MVDRARGIALKEDLLHRTLPLSQEKFYFDNPAVCMVYNAGELSLIE